MSFSGNPETSKPTQQAQPAHGTSGTLKVQLPGYLEFLDPEDEQKKCIEFRDRVIAFQK